LKKYKTFTKQLAAFAESRGYAMLDQFMSSGIDVFYGGWNLAARTKGERLGTLRAFFRFCTNWKWLLENPVRADIKPPIGASWVANKAPYTDEELQRIIDACDNLGEVAWFNSRETGVYTGNDVKDFIWVMVYTGLRISDVGLFNMTRLSGNEIFLEACSTPATSQRPADRWARGFHTGSAAKTKICRAAGLARAGFLPSQHQGTNFDDSVTAPDKMIRYLQNKDLDKDTQRRQLDLIQAMNRGHEEQFGQDEYLEGRIQSMETAYSMQSKRPTSSL
jgi:hypothetical protein